MINFQGDCLFLMQSIDLLLACFDSLLMCSTEGHLAVVNSTNHMHHDRAAINCIGPALMCMSMVDYPVSRSILQSHPMRLLALFAL